MKKIITITAILFSAGFISCTKDKLEAVQNCIQGQPSWCATVRCTQDGRLVCGCNYVTYSSACEAQCAGVTWFTSGACR